MTKSDVASWFCKVIALVGMLGAAFSSVNSIFDWKNAGPIHLMYAVTSLFVYGLLWRFMKVIGRFLAAESEGDLPLSSGTELGALLVRCAGFYIFVYALVNLGAPAMVYCYESLFPYPSRSRTNYFISYITRTSLECIVGFLLAFWPRIRAVFGSGS